MNSSRVSRRSFLRLTASTGVVALSPRLVLAAADTSSRFVVVILRGALDGLSAVVPHAEPAYSRMRGELAISDTSLKLDGTFALHPSLTALHARHAAKELIAFQAVASPYRERSHFDGQDVLENGTARPSVRDGWLNRMLQTLSATEQAIALSQNVPLVLQGDARVNSWSPSRLPTADADTLQRIADLYSTDQYFASRLQAALATDAIAGSDTMEDRRRDPLGGFSALATSAGQLLAAETGPRIAVMEAGGWDTHANQGAERGLLANRLRSLDQGLESLRTALGAVWRKTAVLVVTEFGRTVAVNGTRGTDHGTATCALLVGGAVTGGRVIADWPGLAPSSLYQARDLRPTTDLRSICKGILGAHLAVDAAALETRVFPDSQLAKPVEGLIANKEGDRR